MKTILLPIFDDDGQEPRFQAALDVARTLDAHLVCLDLLESHALLPSGAYYEGLAMRLLEDLHEHLTEVRTRLQERLACEDVRWDWREGDDMPATATKEAARLSDLVVMSCRVAEGEPGAAGSFVGQIAAELHRPILAVPPSLKRFDPIGPALVAWDASQEASDALHDAVPLLSLSERVVILDCGDGAGHFASTDAAMFLSRNGIHGEVEQEHGGIDAGPRLIQRGMEIGARYITMGAYGHWPITEAVFGGVTRYMLAESEVPLLLAH